MITPSGIIELDSGWSIGVVPVGSGRLRLFFLFDPDRLNLTHGLREVPLKPEEADELIEQLRTVRSRLNTDGG